MKQFSISILRYLNYRNQIRFNDVFIASYPKSGNTWLSYIIANIVISYNNLPIKVTQYSVRNFVSEMHTHAKLPNAIEPFPRFIKTHNKECHFFHNSIYLVRNPIQTMASYYIYCLSLGHIPQDTTFNKFIRMKSFGINNWIHHTEGWLKRTKIGSNVQIFRYEDLKEDTYTEIQRMLDVLGLKISSEIVKNAIDNSDRTRMGSDVYKSMQSKFTRADLNYKFVREDTNRPRTNIDDDSLALITSKTKSLASELGYQL